MKSDRTWPLVAMFPTNFLPLTPFPASPKIGRPPSLPAEPPSGRPLPPSLRPVPPSFVVPPPAPPAPDEIPLPVPVEELPPDPVDDPPPEPVDELPPEPPVVPVPVVSDNPPVERQSARGAASARGPLGASRAPSGRYSSRATRRGSRVELVTRVRASDSADQPQGQ